MAQDRSRYHVLILSAGFSERMGAFKPLLPLGDASVLERLVGMYRRAGLETITVVDGHRGDEVRQVARAAGAAGVHNPHPEQGMYSSVRVGVGSLPPGVRRVFIHPVDIPLVRTDTIRLLLRAADASDAPVLMPWYDEEPGHPPVIGPEVFADILAGDGRGGLRAVLDRHEQLRVPVADREILFDLDRPPDYHEALNRLADKAALTPGEAEKLLRLYFGAPEHLVRHSALVVRLTRAMLRALAAGGTRLDAGLALAGAWLHDAGKGRPGHARAGAEALAGLGFPAVAEIVLVHNNCDWPDDGRFDERSLVALADKMAQGDRVVTVEERFADKLNLFAGDPGAAAAITERLRGAGRLARRFETLSGTSLGEIAREVAANASEKPDDQSGLTL